jgi:NO-binding membrane sensor protein with MHYT domain
VLEVLYTGLLVVVGLLIACFAGYFVFKLFKSQR